LEQNLIKENRIIVVWESLAIIFTFGELNHFQVSIHIPVTEVPFGNIALPTIKKVNFWYRPPRNPETFRVESRTCELR